MVQVFNSVIGMMMLGVCLLFTIAEVHFTLNPAMIQSGDQPVPAEFMLNDGPMLIFWCATSIGLLATLVVVARRTLIGFRR